MPSEHQMARALNRSPVFALIEQIVAKSHFPQQAKLQALRAYEHMFRCAQDGEPSMWRLVLVAESLGLRDIRIEADGVSAIRPDGQPVRFTVSAEPSTRHAA